MITIHSMLPSILLVGCLSASASAAAGPALHQVSAPGRVAILRADRYQPQGSLELALSHTPARAAATTPARWQQQAELTASDGEAGDHLGGPVAVSHGTALVGAWDRHQGAGAAYIFVQHGNG